jgi:hypothetical protein
MDTMFWSRQIPLGKKRRRRKKRLSLTFYYYFNYPFFFNFLRFAQWLPSKFPANTLVLLSSSESPTIQDLIRQYEWQKIEVKKKY